MSNTFTEEAITKALQDFKRIVDEFNRQIAEITGNEDVDPNTIT
jgi:hypothetical protein